MVFNISLFFLLKLCWLAIVGKFTLFLKLSDSPITVMAEVLSLLLLPYLLELGDCP